MNQAMQQIIEQASSPSNVMPTPIFLRFLKTPIWLTPEDAQSGKVNSQKLVQLITQECICICKSKMEQHQQSAQDAKKSKFDRILYGIMIASALQMEKRLQAHLENHLSFELLELTDEPYLHPSDSRVEKIAQFVLEQCLLECHKILEQHKQSAQDTKKSEFERILFGMMAGFTIQTSEHIEKHFGLLH